jgi:ubiquinone biosynthesis protein
VRVLARHGFGWALRRDRLGEVDVDLPADAPDASAAAPTARPLGERLRELLEDLGPTFIKLGQILSTRPDVVPAALAEAMERLQDGAPRLDLEVVRGVIASELGRSVEQVFVRFDEAPLATASIAQVHRAVILREGREMAVVVKVQRPGIKELMQADLSLLRWLARAAEGTIEEASAYAPTTIVDQFAAVLREELDFRHELKNIERARTNFAGRPELLVVPEPVPEASGERVLVMEFLAGAKVTEAAKDPKQDREAILHRIVDTTFKQVFEDGFFHGDPHPGNVLVLPDGRIGMIDYGLWGRLSVSQQDQLIDLLSSIAFKSPPTMTRLVLRMGQVPPGFDRGAFEREVRALMDRYVGVSLAQLSSGSLIGDAVDVIRRHRIQIPPEFAVLARATATLEGVLREVYPAFDLQALALPYVKKLLLRRFDVERAGPEAMGLLLGVRDFVNEVPGQIDQLLRDLSTGRFQVSIRPESFQALDTAQRVQGLRQVLTTLAAADMLAAAIASLQADPWRIHGLPVIPIVALAAGLLSMIGLVLTFVFPKGLRRIRLGALLGRRR